MLTRARTSGNPKRSSGLTRLIRSEGMRIGFGRGLLTSFEKEQSSNLNGGERIPHNTGRLQRSVRPDHEDPLRTARSLRSRSRFAGAIPSCSTIEEHEPHSRGRAIFHSNRVRRDLKAGPLAEGWKRANVIATRAAVGSFSN